MNDVQLEKWSREYKLDLINICNNANRKYLSDRLPYPYTNENAEWWLDMVEKQEGREGVFRAIVYQGKCVGNITVEKKNDVFCKDCEIGYVLNDDFSGRGIMTQAIHDICAIAFEELDILRITACVYKPNKASSKILLRNGFRQEGILKNGVYKNNEVYDLVMYGKYKEETQILDISKDELASQIHTTKLGYDRCKNNLGIEEDVIRYCQNLILNKNSHIKQEGKNYYVQLDQVEIVVNAKSFTLITAHMCRGT
ncbi:GNAT family N-acetyltransferase [Anaerorhabdus sp.]|uniref:GNAT family N-acetyltransferase n=1 Tax=Anaerorhabdus sp. TaxID=1872524 RepID=UPI002FC65A14